MGKTRKKRVKHLDRMTQAARDLARRGRVSIEPNPWDHGATGQANRIGLVIEERGELDPITGKTTNPNGVTGVRRVDMLDLYLKREVITPRAHAAGLILRHAWLKTGMGQCAPFLRERVDSTPKPDAAVAILVDRITALVRVSRLIPQRDERIIGIVCEHGAGVGALPEYRGPRHPLGLMHLAAALESLADVMERA